MPLYEYKCQDCDKITEVRQKFSDAPLTICEDCGGTIKKLISQAGFALKGGGWYDQGYSGCSSASPSNESCATCPKAS